MAQNQPKPAPEQTSTLAQKDAQKTFDGLHKALTKMYDGPNVITQDNFHKYRPLFNSRIAETLSNERLAQISSAFFQEINPYREIHVVRNSDYNDIIVKLPPIFTQISTTPNTQETEELSERNFRIGRHDIPKHAANGLRPYADFFLHQQETDENIESIRQQRDVYRETMMAFHGHTSSDNETAHTEPTSPTVDDDIGDWDFD